jgi:TRAP-type C4-dicarboxylate transport system substrate-binding protein
MLLQLARRWIVLAMVLGLLVLAGCGGTETSGDGDAAAPTDDAAEPATEEPADDATEPAPEGDGEPEFTLSLAMFTPLNDSGADGSKLLAEKVAEKSGGRLAIDIVGGPEVSAAPEQVSAVQSGVLDMSSNWAYLTVVPEFQAAHLSELDPDEERESGLFDFYVEAFEQHGLRYLGRDNLNTPFHIFTKEPAESPADLRGRIFRTSPIYEPLLAELGAEGTAVDSGEVYGALDTGVVDGVVYLVSHVVTDSLYEVLNYSMGPEFFHKSNVVMAMNLDKWNSLPPDLQEILEESQYEVEVEISERREQTNAEEWEVARSEGIEDMNWSEEESQALYDAVQTRAWERMEEVMDPEVARELRELMTK